MYCTRCGRKLPEGSRECPYCSQGEGENRQMRTAAPAGPEAGRMPERKTPGGASPGKRKGTVKKRVLLAAAVLIAVAAAVGIMTLTSKVIAGRQYEEQLSLGERYLEELDYEAAVAAFEEAIRIDPKREDAYLGLAEVYIAQGDYEEAEKILDDAYSVIHTESLKDRMTKLEEERREAEETRRAQQEEASEADAAREESREEEKETPAGRPAAEQNPEEANGNQDGPIPVYERGEVILEGWLERVEFEHAGNGSIQAAYILNLDQPAIFRVMDWDTEEEYETALQDSVQLVNVEGSEQAVGQHVRIQGDVDTSQPTAYYIREVAVYSGTCQPFEGASAGNTGTQAAGASTASQADVEARVEEIRGIYYGIQDNLSALRMEDGGGGTTRYYDGTDRIRKIVAAPGTYVSNNVYGAEKYTAEFYYDEDEKLAFVFVYNASDGSEYRFYMNGLTQCVRYIDAQGTVTDYPQPVSPQEISEFGQYCELGMMEIAWAYGG